MFTSSAMAIPVKSGLTTMPKTVTLRAGRLSTVLGHQRRPHTPVSLSRAVRRHHESARRLNNCTWYALAHASAPSALFTFSLVARRAAVLAQRTQSSLLWIARSIPDLKLPFLI
jgi:hypothetical protein